jgi:hypothetical protein
MVEEPENAKTMCLLMDILSSIQVLSLLLYY